MSEQNETKHQSGDALSNAIALAETVNAQNYNQLAKATETFPDVERPLDRPTVETLVFVLHALQDATHLADTLKRRFFYGKGVEFADITENVLAKEGGPIAVPAGVLQERVMLPRDWRLFHAFLGKFTEAGELLQAWGESFFRDKPLDRLNVFEEMGDDDWYNQIIVRVLQLNQLHWQQANIAKLAYRYPNKFNPEHAVNRDTGGEREALRHFLEKMDVAFPAPEALNPTPPEVK